MCWDSSAAIPSPTAYPVILSQWRFLMACRRWMRSRRRCCASRCCCRKSSRCVCADRSPIRLRRSPSSAPVPAPLRASIMSISLLFFLFMYNLLLLRFICIAICGVGGLMRMLGVCVLGVCYMIMFVNRQIGKLFA